jgi:7-cyano-7-deazaguanine synthase
MTDKALIVLSGGQDSTTCLYIAKLGGHEVHAVTFDYGQRHRRELQAASDIAKMAGVASHEIVELGPILKSTSPLVDSTVPLEQYADNAAMERIIGDRIELTFVPMRNALFLTIAANRAIALGANSIWTGVCQADNAGYPDCREDFIRAQELAICAATGRNDLKIITPLLHVPKPDSIRIALSIPGCYTALGYSHTAYDGSYPPTGHDHATVLRAHSFEVAGVPDPLIIRAFVERVLPELPSTANYAQWTGLSKSGGTPHDVLVWLEEQLRKAQ